MTGMASIKLKYLCMSRSRHGAMRYYVRLPGRTMVRLPDDPTDPAFMLHYREATEGAQAPKATAPAGPGQVAPGSFRALCMAYRGSSVFQMLSQATREQRVRVMESMCLEPLKPGGDKLFGDGPAKAMNRRAIEVLRDRKAHAREAANHRVKTLFQIFRWAAKAGMVSVNPVTGIDRFPKRGSGHHAWATHEVRQYLDRHGPGSKARLALGLLLFTGVRISDLALIGPQHVREGVLTFRPYKGRERHPQTLHIPVLPVLQQILDTSPLGEMTFMATEFARPFSIKGLGQWFKKRCIEAGLPHCSAHGLRKAGATVAADNGATAHQLMAIYGWSNIKEAETYTREADRRRLAKEAIRLIDIGEILRQGRLDEVSSN